MIESFGNKILGLAIKKNLFAGVTEIKVSKAKSLYYLGSFKIVLFKWQKQTHKNRRVLSAAGCLINVLSTFKVNQKLFSGFGR